MQHKFLIAIVLALALCTSSIIMANDVIAKTHKKVKTTTHHKKHHQPSTNPGTGNNTVNQTTTTVSNVTNQANPLFTTGLKTICFNGVTVQNAVSTPSVICEALTIQKTK